MTAAPPERILVATDGSRGADRAVEFAIRLAEGLGAEIIAVHAVGLLTHLAARLEPADHEREKIRAVFESSWCAPLRRSAVAWRPMLVDGSPVPAIIAASNEVDADLIVVGSRGHGSLPDLLIGSTSRQLVEHSDRPVLVVPDSGPPI